MDFFLPQANWGRHRPLGGIVDIPARTAPPLHNNLNRAANADQQNRQAAETPGAVAEDAARNRVGVMVADIHHNIQPQAAMGGKRLI